MPISICYQQLAIEEGNDFQSSELLKYEKTLETSDSSPKKSHQTCSKV